MFENVNIAAAAGIPAICGMIGLFVTAALFKRPYIAIAGAVLGVLIGMGFVAA